MNNLRRTALGSFIIMVISIYAYPQQLVDAVSAIVGDEIILLSEVESIVMTQRSMGDRTPADRLRCEVFEDMLIQKLFLDQARIDSIEITDDEVNRELDMRLNNFIMRAGSEENLEQYYNKSMVEIRRDLRDMISDQSLTAQMQSTIASKIEVTPAEVRKFFNKLPEDSLPILPAKVEVSIIQIDPPNAEQDKLEVRQRLLDLRRRIIEGESFRALAILYSEDEGTASRGGETGLAPRSALDKAYADEAFSLKQNTVSRVIESQFGFHIIELIERRGEMVNSRHILMKPKVKPDEAVIAINRLDSIADLIRKDSMTFNMGAMRFSTHKDSRINGGKYVTPDSRESLIVIDDLPPEMYIKVRDLEIGEISEGFKTKDEKGYEVFRIVQLNKQTTPHKANLKDDFSYLQELAQANKTAGIYMDWVAEKMKVTYIKISDEFKTCNFANEGWLK
ncbi:MAG TPA: peptidylprolyl isomerase [Bacteroidales bacterium]|nr:peptidylprolyl isomerase [Bacteroidales bacterium]